MHLDFELFAGKDDIHNPFDEREQLQRLTEGQTKLLLYPNNDVLLTCDVSVPLHERFRVLNLTLKSG